MSEMNKMNDQRWENHSDFLAGFASNITYLSVTFESGNKHEKAEAVKHLVKNLSFLAFKHAEKHCLEDFENGVFERVFEQPVGNRIVEVSGKVVGVTQKADVSENQVVGEISVSGDRVKREGPSWDKDKKGWDVAKRAPVDSGGSDEPSWDEYKKRWNEAKPVWDNHRQEWNEAKREPVDKPVIDDDSVIKTQEECAKRFAEGQAVRRNYAGIND